MAEKEHDGQSVRSAAHVLPKKERIEAFKAGLQGELIQRGDERYDAARKVYNAMIDKPPLLIVRCADVADVLAAVNFGRENKRQTHHLGFTPSISLHVNTTSRPSCIHFSSSTWQQVIPLRDDTFLPSF